MRIIKTLIFIIIVWTGLFSPACSSASEFEKVAFDQACGGEGEFKKILVEGYISNQSISCSLDRSGRRNCSLTLSENLSESKPLDIYFSLVEGKGSNQIETPESEVQNKKSASTFARENLKIRGNNGNVMDLKEKVALSGKTTLLISSTMMPVCQMTATKVEQK